MSRLTLSHKFLILAAAAWVGAAVIALAYGTSLASASTSVAPLRLIWPETDSVISQVFGPSRQVIEPAYGSYAHFHTGIDFAAPVGSPVLAAAAGQVVVIGQEKRGAVEKGYGDYVIVAHAGRWATLYAHLLNTPLVHLGETLLQGQRVGLEGTTGNSTGPHLHFELRLDGAAVDPAPYLNPSP